MKKYFIFAAAALVAMCACTKNELASEIANQEISFQVANYAEGTKAGDAKLGLNESFGVYAYYNTVDWTATTGTTNNVYMNGVEISHAKNGTATDWAPATSYYWPKTGKLTFVGWAPFDKTPSFSKTTGITWSNFALTTTPGDDNKVDLMYSDVKANQTANTTSGVHTGVPMLFHHALAQLNFNVEYNTDNLNTAQIGMFNIQITSITLKQLGNTATYTSAAWGTPSNKADVALAGTSSLLDKDNLTQTGYVTDYYIIPQGTVELWIDYKVNDIACTTAKLPLSFSVTEESDPTTAWAMNTIYTYNIKISPVKNGPNDKPITFDPSVEAWTTVDAGNIDVK